MKLTYYEGNNFGDKLNPFIFNKLLTNFFDDDEKIKFLGIGSIIGFDDFIREGKKIVFSSGWGYGAIPEIDKSFDIICVRGPLTCSLLKIDKKYSITDGAILIRDLYKPKVPTKKYKFSFMPHWTSELKFNWQKICMNVGINYISPTADVFQVIDEIYASEVMLSEAMHGAIIADTYRIPWIPVKCYKGINDFKWQDWTSSINMKYNPTRLNSMFDINPYTSQLLDDKIRPAIVKTLMKKSYLAYKSQFQYDILRRKLNQLKEKEYYLSKDSLSSIRHDQLMDKIQLLNKNKSKIK